MISKSKTRYLYVGIVLFLVFYVIISMIYRSDLVQSKIQTVLEDSLSGAFRREIKAESLSGNLFSQLRLHNVVIASEDTIENGFLIKADEINASFSIIKLIQQLDFLAGIQIVNIVDVEMRVVRNKQDVWNLLDFAIPPPVPEGQPIPPPSTFRGKIYLHNVHGVFIDEKGWAKTPLETPFKDYFKDLAGFLDFTEFDHVRMNFVGKFQKTETPLSISGIFNAFKGNYDLNINVPLLNTERWGFYLFPKKGFMLSSDTISIYGNLLSKPVFVPNEVPFYYSLYMDFETLQFDMPFLKEPLENIRGKLELSNKGGDRIKFHYFSGFVTGIPLRGVGEIKLNTESIDLSITTESFQMEGLKSLFPVLEMWSYSGSGATKFSVKGRLDKPKIKGQFYIDDLVYYGVKSENLELSYQLDPDMLRYTIDKGTLYGGRFNGEGWVETSKKNPKFDLLFNTQKMPLSTIFPNLKTALSDDSAVTGNIQLSGNWDSFEIRSQFSSQGLMVYHQPIESVVLKAHVSDHKHIKFSTIQLGLKDNGTLFGNATIHNLDLLDLKFKGDNIKVNDIDPKGTLGSKGIAFIQGQLSGPIAPLLKNPKDNAALDLTFAMTGGALMGQSVDRLDIKLSYKNTLLELHKGRIETEGSNLYLDGVLEGNHLKKGTLKTGNWPLDLFQLGDVLFPKKWDIQKGILDSSLKISSEMSRSSKESVFSGKGWLRLTNLSIQDQDIDSAYSKFSILKNKGVIHTLDIRHQDSRIVAKGEFEDLKSINMTVLNPTKVDFKDFQTLTRRYAKVEGIAHISGKLMGDIRKPSLDFSINAVSPRFNQFQFDTVKGRLKFKDHRVVFEPLHLFYQEGSYKLEGDLLLTPFYKELSKFNRYEMDYDVKLDVENGDLRKLVDYMQSIQAKEKDVTTYTENRSFENNDQSDSFVGFQGPFVGEKKHVLYSFYDNETSLTHYNTQWQLIGQRDTTYTAITDYNILGKTTGMFHIQDRLNSKPKFKVDAVVENAQFREFSAETLALNLDTKQTITDINITIKDGYIRDSEIKEFSFQGRYYNDNGVLLAEKVSIRTSDHYAKNIMSGTFPIAAYWDKNSRERKVNLKVNLSENDIDVLRLLSNDIAKIQNKGRITVSVTGDITQPKFNGAMVLKNAKVSFKEASSLKGTEFFVKSYNGPIQDGHIQLLEDTVFWRDVRKRRFEKKKHINKFVIDGSFSVVEWDMLAWNSLILSLDLRLNPTLLEVDLDTVFLGKLALNNTQILGRYNVPLNKSERSRKKRMAGTEQEQGPVISGDIVLTEGQIYFPVIGEKKLKPSFHLDLTAHIKSGVYVGGGFFGGGALTLANNVYLELRESDVQVGGTLNLMSVKNSLLIKDGSMNLFDRYFELLSKKDQVLYFEDTPDQVGENKLYFVTDYPKNSKSKHLIPAFDIKAVTFDEEQSIDTEEPDSKTYKAIMVHLDGRLDDFENSLDMAVFRTSRPYAHSLDLALIQRFDTPLAKATNERDKAEAIGLISPQILDRTGKADFEEIGEKQANILFRKTISPIERKIARKVGLYDLRVNYNVGRTLRENFGSEDAGYDDENLLGLNFIWGLFSDKLLLRLKTDINTSSETQSSSNNLKLTEFELTYNLTKSVTWNLSHVSEYRELSAFRPLMSLKFKHAF